MADLPPSEALSIRHGYYAGSTEEGEEVAFIVRRADPDLPIDRNLPWKIALITNFKARLNVRIIDPVEGDSESPASQAPHVTQWYPRPGPA